MTIAKKLFMSTILLYLLILIVWPLPDSKIQWSKALYDKDNTLLAAVTSSEGQWCFPVDEKIPNHLEIAIREFEDAHMAYHPGINPVSLIKSIKVNIEKGRIIRGASTLAMQVMRMKNRNASRTIKNKILESISALKYSLLNSDKEIIRDWAEIAPYGGNVIGVKAAALRYFGRPLQNLSWAEYALLAVMPNSPGTVNLTINRDKILAKRNQLLTKLHFKGYINKDDLQVFKDEDLPVDIKSIPQNGYHLLRYLIKKYPQQNIYYATLHEDIQQQVQNIAQQESDFYRYDDIKNLACLVVDIEKNELLAYVGNVKQDNGRFDYVDIIQSPRSFGSLLKPFLYAHALNDNQYLPHEIVADIPTTIGDFQPENFDEKYRGAVKLEEMVTQSLNVPAVRILNDVGLQAFYDNIQLLQPKFLNKGPDHYGLSLILGGGEMTMWDLARMYKGLAQNYYNISYPFSDFKTLRTEANVAKKISFKYSAFAIKNTVETMADLTRPREEKYNHIFKPNNKIAWKTGTSYGHRDAWSIGFNGKYMVAVWVGNGDGEGRYNLTGITKAAPIMFKIFKALPNNKWFARPPQYSRKETIKVCQHSGKMASRLCNDVHQEIVEKSNSKYKQCSHHITGSTDDLGRFISNECAHLAYKRDTFYVLPPTMDFYHKIANPHYKGLPTLSPLCMSQTAKCQLLYPHNGLKIFLPREKMDSTNPLICKAHHHDKDATIYWFMNNKLIKTTNSENHEITILLNRGLYEITIIDDRGQKDFAQFEILSR